MIASRDEIGPTITAIRVRCYEQARADQWPQDWLRDEIRNQIANFVEDLRLWGHDEWADFVEKTYKE